MTVFLRRSLLSGCAAVAITALTAGTAMAERPATPTERRAVQKAAMKYCTQGGDPSCHKSKVEISTVNEKYAYGGAYSDGTAAYMLKHKHGTWRVIAVQGGGVQTCSYWYHHAPRRVVHDFKITGVRRPNSQRAVRC